MNKVILISDRFFLAFAGPCGSGKTDLMFNMLEGRSFYPAFPKTYYFYKQFQDTFTAMQQNIPPIEFIKFSGLDITKKLSDCLLVYDDSCEEIFSDKEFLKIATSGRKNYKKELQQFESQLRQLCGKSFDALHRSKLFQKTRGCSLIRVIARPCTEFLQKSAYWGTCADSSQLFYNWTTPSFANIKRAVHEKQVKTTIASTENFTRRATRSGHTA